MPVLPRVIRSSGPIVALARSADDPCIHKAAVIALAAQEDLAIPDADGGGADDPRWHQLAAETGGTVQHVAAANIGQANPAAYAEAFRQIQERLIVMSRGTFEDAIASELAGARRVPVLVV
jgi:hypothetical protein